jgi:hypothetical protein
MLEYLKLSENYVLTIGGNNLFEKDGSININTYIDSSHGIHNDYRGQTGILIKLGDSTIMARSAKQKTNTKSTAETELIGVSEEFSQSVWTKYWLEDAGYKVNKLNIYQDNKSAIVMLLNGKPSGRAARHINIRHFLIKNYIDEGIINLEYVNTDNMLVDVLTKPLQGKKLKFFTSKILKW